MENFAECPIKNVTVITGAGSGMGLEMAKIFGRQGPVVVCGRTLSKIEKAVEELKCMGVEAHGASCDVSDKASVDALAKMASSLGNIRVVVNSAGVSPSSADSKTIYRINLLGTIHVAESFFPLMAEGSVLVNISSMAGHMMPMNQAYSELFAIENTDELIETALKSFPENHAYSISKRFVIEYTKDLGAKFSKKKVRVVSISPGTFDTPMLDTVRERDTTKQMIQMTPAGRTGDPVEIAHLAEFLVSDKATYITGTDVLIDGGYVNVLLEGLKAQKEQ